MSKKIISKRLVFGLMAALVLVSAVLAFTVLRKPKPGPFPKMHGLGVSSGVAFSKTLGMYQDLGQVEMLGQQIRQILKKKKLNQEDSMVLKYKLRQIDSIYKRVSAH